MIITSHMQNIIQIYPCLLKLSRKQESVTDRRYYYIPNRYRGGIIRHPNDDWSSGFKGWKEGVSNRWKDGRQTPKNGNSDCLVRWAKKNWMITNFRYKKTIQVQCTIPVSSNVWKNLEKKYEETLNILM